MNADIGTTASDLQKLQDRFKKINIVNDQITNWSKRVYQKFGLLTDDAAFQQEQTDLVAIFEVMDISTGKELDSIK